MSDEELTARYEITEAIGLAARLLTVAAENAKAIPVAIALPITTAIEADKHASLTPSVEAHFWAAFTQLCQTVQPVSVASFSRNYILSTRRRRRAYVICNIVLLAFLVPLSLCGFIVTAVSADIQGIAEATCIAEPDLGCARPPLSGQPNQTRALTNSDLRSRQSVNFAGYRVYQDDVLLNHLVLLNPWTTKDLRGAFKCHCVTGDTDEEKQECAANEGAYRSCNSSTTEWREEKNRDYARTFEGNIYFARSLKAER